MPDPNLLIIAGITFLTVYGAAIIFALALARAAAKETPKPKYPEWLREPREGRK